MTLGRSVLTRSILMPIALLFLFQTGCDQLSRPEEKTRIVKIAPDVKIQLAHIAALNIFVGRYEISNREYRCFRPDHSSGSYQEMSLNGDDQPVANVSWNDARAFCEWLTQKFGTSPESKLVFRLPAEKEWKIFATCGAKSEFPWGNWPPPESWNYYGSENSILTTTLESKDGYCVSCPVHKSGKNAWGLFGVGGNVWEWCQDTDHPQSSTHVLKGASWSECEPLFLRTSRRTTYAADYKYVNIGFRVVAETSGVPPAPAAQTIPSPAGNKSTGK